MKKIILGMLLLTLILTPALTLAQQGVCKVNGQEVPCDQMGTAIKESFGGIVFAFFGVWAIFIVLGLLGFILWVVMLIHAATKEIDNKVVWILILVFTQAIGAIIYYFVVKKPYDKARLASSVPNTTTAV